MRWSLVLILMSACGSPVVSETSVPPGEVLNVLDEPDAHARCLLTQEEEMARIAAGCWCATACPAHYEGENGRCVIDAPPTARPIGACPPALVADERERGCEIPDWPLFRCEPGRL